MLNTKELERVIIFSLLTELFNKPDIIVTIPNSDIYRSRDIDDIWATLSALEKEVLIVRSKTNTFQGAICIAMDGSGFDVIRDWTNNIGPLISYTNAIADVFIAL